MSGLLLAVETATRLGSVALFDGADIVKMTVFEKEQDHSARLADAVTALVDKDFGAIEAYAFGVGPGSFTGLRIGLSFLKGLAVVHPRPMVTVSTLELFAHRIFETHADADLALPMLDARRGQVFAALFSPNARRADGRLVEGLYEARAVAERLAEVPGITAGGDGVLVDFGRPVAWQAVEADAATPDAGLLARVAYPRWQAGESVDPLGVQPVYHQRSAAEESLGIDLSPDAG